MTKLAPPPDPTGVRRRRALLAASAAWAVLLVAAGLVSARRDEPTVREQRSVAQAAPVVDRAVGAVLAAARAEPVVLLSAPVVVPGCRLTPALPGAELSRQVTVHTRPADGLAAMRRIGAALPRPYAPAVRPRTGTAAADLDDVSLRADAGEFVTVRGKLAAPGVLRFTVDTGCRPADAARADDRPGREAGAATAALTGLRATGIGPEAWTSAPCPSGGTARTGRAEGRPGAQPVPPAVAIPPPAGGSPLLDEPGRYAVRRGALRVLVESTADRVVAAVTAGCAP